MPYPLSECIFIVQQRTGNDDAERCANAEWISHVQQIERAWNIRWCELWNWFHRIQNKCIYMSLNSGKMEILRWNIKLNSEVFIVSFFPPLLYFHSCSSEKEDAQTIIIITAVSWTCAMFLHLSAQSRRTYNTYYTICAESRCANERLHNFNLT